MGPPGTGKTTVIGQIIDELCRHDRPVLVVSHTNTAVDGAIEKADRTYYSKHGLEEGGSYPILRLGTPSKPLPERVLLKTHTDILGRELYEREAFLKNMLASMQRRQKEVGLLLSKNIWIEKTHRPLFLGDMHPTYEDRISTKRDLPKLTVRTPDGKEIQLKDGEHNAIQKQIIEEFLPRFGYGAILLYCGDSDKKYGLIHEVEELAKIGFTDLKQSILPDVVAYSPEKNWIFLIEAYHTSNPITPQRKMELEQELGENANRVVFVTAFENDSVYRNCPEELAWETEVWIATEPDHMIHRNGHRFMGPYSSNVKRGSLVKHSDLGEGTVVKKENDYIEVTFPEQFKTIRFPYPEVMEHVILKALEV